MLTAGKVDVWTTTVEDGPCALREKMAQLAMSGADLEFLISRRVHEEPGKSVVFLTPITGDKQMQAAEKLGFKKTHSLHSVRVAGPDEPGITYRIASALAEQGIVMHGVSAARLGNEFTMYLSFDSESEADEAATRLNGIL
jgi:prephenate dehydratase